MKQNKIKLRMQTERRKMSKLKIDVEVILRIKSKIIKKHYRGSCLIKYFYIV